MVHKSEKETNDSGPRRFVRLAHADSAVRFESASGNRDFTSVYKQGTSAPRRKRKLLGVARRCTSLRVDPRRRQENRDGRVGRGDKGEAGEEHGGWEPR